jgi:N-methylhydantoinase B
MSGGVGSVTLEVVRNACGAVAEEMNATLVRTSYSPSVENLRDCSCGLFDVRSGAPGDQQAVAALINFISVIDCNRL